MHLPSTPITRLLIADRRPTAASGLAATLEKHAAFVVQGSCHDPVELSTALGAPNAIDAVVIDAEMFGGDAAAAVDAVHQLAPAVPVLLLTTRVDAILLQALERERVSCVSAYSDAQAIVSSLRALLGGETQLPPEVQRALMNRQRTPAAVSLALTSREEQVLELAATGLTIAQIASTLHISHSTAKTHLLRVYEKLEAPNRSAAVAIAITRGLVTTSTAAA